MTPLTAQAGVQDYGKFENRKTVMPFSIFILNPGKQWESNGVPEFNGTGIHKPPCNPP